MMRRLLCAAGVTLALLPGITVVHVAAAGRLLPGGGDVLGPLVVLLAALAAPLVWLVGTAVLIEWTLGALPLIDRVTPRRPAGTDEAARAR